MTSGWWQGLCDHVSVMYAGRIVEFGDTDAIFYRPQHPYTAGLLASSPRLDEEQHGELNTIAGQPPNLQRLPPGCAFAPRCAYVHERCQSRAPAVAEYRTWPRQGLSPGEDSRFGNR